MKRVLVIGSPGAGKTTLAVELSRITGLPLFHLDREFWQPGWKTTPSDQWHRRVHELIEPGEWIIDGTYDSTLNIRLPRADTVVFLDFPRYLCLWRIIKRVIVNFGRVRHDMGEGCPEKVDLGFIKWVWNYRRDHYPKIEKSLRENFHAGHLVVVDNPHALRKFISSLH